MAIRILLAFLCLHVASASANIIQLETNDDYNKLLDSNVTDMVASGSIKIDNKTSIPYQVTISASPDMGEHNRITVTSIQINIDGKKAVFTGKALSSLVWPKLPNSMTVYGLKPNGLLIEFSGPDGAESYRCQIQALPEDKATIFYQDWFGGSGGGFQKVQRLATSKFK